MATEVRFDMRFKPDTTLGSSYRKKARRTLTTIKSGKAAFGNKEMRAIFKGK